MFAAGYAILLVLAYAVWPYRRARWVLVALVLIGIIVAAVLLLMAAALGGFGVLH
jgi:hypothetical protein